MTNKKQLITALTLSAVLLTGAFNLTPLAYSTGWNHDDDDDNHDYQKIKICHIPPGNPNNAHTITISKSAWDAHKEHGDYKGKCNNDDDDREDCKCRKPSTLTVKYNGPPGTVDIEIYKKLEDVGSSQKKLLLVTGISNDNTVKIDSNIFGKESLETNTFYRVMQGTTQLAVVTINTSCSQPLFIGKQYTNNQITLTIVSGEDSKGKQSIFLEHDPICEGAKLTVTKIVDDPPLNSGKFILKISKDVNQVYQSAELGNGESTGPQSLMPGTYTVSEIAGTETDLDNYVITIGGDCNPDDGSIELEKGDKAECIITNTRIQPATITIEKRVTEDNTNENVEVGAGVFSFSIKNTETDQLIPIDSENKSVPPGTYTLIEEGPDNFDPVIITGDEGCPMLVDETIPNLNEDLIQFTLSSGQDLTCIVYNEDDADSTSGGTGVSFGHKGFTIEIDAGSGQLLPSNRFCNVDDDPDTTDFNDACLEPILDSDGLPTPFRFLVVDQELVNPKNTLVLMSMTKDLNINGFHNCVVVGFFDSTEVVDKKGFGVYCAQMSISDPPHNLWNINYAFINTNFAP